MYENLALNLPLPSISTVLKFLNEKETPIEVVIEFKILIDYNIKAGNKLYF